MVMNCAVVPLAPGAVVQEKRSGVAGIQLAVTAAADCISGGSSGKAGCAAGSGD